MKHRRKQAHAVQASASPSDADEVTVLRSLAASCLACPDRVDRCLIRTAQTQFQKQGYDENIFQVSVRVCGQILFTLHKMGLLSDNIFGVFLSGQTLYSLAITEGVGATGDHRLDSVRETAAGYTIRINKRLICGVDKTDFTLVFVAIEKNSYLFRIDNGLLTPRRMWTHGPCTLFRLKGDVKVPAESLIAEGALARSIVEDALYEERDGLDALNFLATMTPFKTLARGEKIAVLIYRLCYSQVIFAPLDVHYRRLLILALKISTASTVAEIVFGLEASAEDKTKAFTFSIAGGSDRYIKSLIWTYRKIYLKTIDNLVRKKSITGPPARLFALIKRLETDDIVENELEETAFVEVLISLFVTIVILSLARDSGSKLQQSLATLYFDHAAPANDRRLARLLGARILDLDLEVTRVFCQMLAR